MLDVAAEIRQIKRSLSEVSLGQAASTPAQTEALTTKKAQLEAMLELTLPHGALTFLKSHHLQAPPKVVKHSSLPPISIKQVVGMVAMLPELDAEDLARRHVLEWNEGIDTQAKRQETTYERLAEALNHSGVAYVEYDERFRDAVSCWDGGMSRVATAASQLVSLAKMPPSGEFAKEFQSAVLSVLNECASDHFMADASPDVASLRSAVAARMNQDVDALQRSKEGGPLCVSPELYSAIEPKVRDCIRKVYPNTHANPENRQATEQLISTALESLQYIAVPESVVAAYTRKMPAHSR